MYAPAIGRASLTERTVLAGREVFLGRRRGPLAMLPFVGPAVIASIAYMDTTAREIDPRKRFVADSPLEEGGFEPSVPLRVDTGAERSKPGLTDEGDMPVRPV